MPEANSESILSNSLSRYPRIAPAPAQKPKLLDRLCEALRSRHHVDESLVQKAVRVAVSKAGLTKHATCHTFTP